MAKTALKSVLSTDDRVSISSSSNKRLFLLVNPICTYLTPPNSELFSMYARLDCEPAGARFPAYCDFMYRDGI